MRVGGSPVNGWGDGGAGRQKTEGDVFMSRHSVSCHGSARIDATIASRMCSKQSIPLSSRGGCSAAPPTLRCAPSMRQSRGFRHATHSPSQRGRRCSLRNTCKHDTSILGRSKSERQKSREMQHFIADNLLYNTGTIDMELRNRSCGNALSPPGLLGALANGRISLRDVLALPIPAQTSIDHVGNAHKRGEPPTGPCHLGNLRIVL